MNTIKRMLRRAVLFPLFMLIGIPEGDAGAGGGDGGDQGDPGGGGSLLTNDDPAAGGGGGEPTSEEKAAAEAAAAEEARRAALTDEQRAAEDKAKADAEKAKEGAPEEYADFTVPEGLVINNELLGEFKTYAKDLNLSQDQAQKLVDMQSKAIQEMHTERIEAWNNTQKQWLEELKADKEYGGDKYDETVTTAKRALNTFAPKESNPGLYKMLDDYGIGNHPEMIKLMCNLGKAMREDTFINGGKVPGSPKTLEQKLYGSK